MSGKWLQVFKNKRADLKEIIACAIANAIVILAILLLKQAGGLQTLELIAFDIMVRLRDDLEPDPRLLIVGITEEDIVAFNRWPLSDEVIAQLLDRLSQLQPQAIGLDIYRDIPYEPGHQSLIQQLDNPKIITIKTLGDADFQGTPAPPTVPPSRVGFNDLLLDPDGVVRRNLMLANIGNETFYSFSMRLALRYWQKQGIEPTNSPLHPDDIRWGAAEFLPLDRTSGGYQTIDDQGYQILLDYRSRKPLARVVSVSEVLYGNIPSSWVEDKIVLIGTIAPSGKDLFLTPYSPSRRISPKMPGVLIHAQMVSQLLDVVAGERSLFVFWPPWAEFVWAIAWGVVGVMVVVVVRHPLVWIFCPLLMLGVLWMGGFYLFLNSVWVPMVTPSLTLLFTSVIVIIYLGFRAQRQQQVVMGLLGQNASPEIAKALWNSRDRLMTNGKLPGEKLVATMLFTDIRNFSTISEQIPPEQLIEWLNEYLATLTQCVHSHRGIINKFMGDGIMAAFGVPIARTTEAEIAQDAYAAVACALEMGDRLMELNKLWQSQNLPVIEMRVGIFTGPIVAGSLGSRDRLEYCLLGDSVNIASRLESCEKDRQSEPCRILIAYQTLVYLPDVFEVESWGLIPLKGKQQLIDVYRILGWQSPPQP
ncbi:MULTISPECIES: adenylate/guanylate cyclase domain-containing protein [unclassified Limnospira]|uniref:CHASE2 domain-containing protein n=1 Tax=unclassified Limnospira TaxID=2642885 RepID=UPI0028E121E0|nr:MULTISPECIES: adenylate/guanylate cyclase domain-containing protein [unclassified Limnospira]MDT9192376.1 adenylate/guanylate cyclase domain-containing protein [Limnospira sp. PMC 1245.20]MDT9212789.1 adenylate/guanylate cyclase domain-containing protein [Limnospira sp. PMC 1256.20]MDT9253586.1 adenylate/guanylate cyclase domain-containing protein [Limnospira sp. PMC 1254.20]MDT9258425.1 adenylate/guanylate cyclase domain-containing protein [Limnospira sp. PMC 1236.20]MDT9279033.1 adenylate